MSVEQERVRPFDRLLEVAIEVAAPPEMRRKSLSFSSTSPLCRDFLVIQQRRQSVPDELAPSWPEPSLNSVKPRVYGVLAGGDADQLLASIRWYDSNRLSLAPSFLNFAATKLRALSILA